MKRTLKMLMMSTAALMALAAAPSPSEAHIYGAYACEVQYDRAEGANGNAGMLWVNYYSGSGCSGNYLGVHYYCSKSATSAYCPASDANLFTRDELLALRHEILEQVRSGFATTSYNTPCRNGNATLCAATVRFFSD